MSSIEDFIGIKYKLEKSENFDDFMKAVGVSFITRKLANSISPVIELKKEEDEYNLTSTSTFKNIALKFKPEVEFEQETPDGRTGVKTVIKVDGNKLIEKQMDKDVEVIRTFTPEECNMEMTCGGVKAVRTYKKV